MRKDIVYVNTQNDMISRVLESIKEPGSYLVALKYIGMPEIDCLGYKKTTVENGKLYVSGHECNINLLESITVRTCKPFSEDHASIVKTDYEHRLSSKAMVTLLSEKIRDTYTQESRNELG